MASRKPLIDEAGEVREAKGNRRKPIGNRFLAHPGVTNDSFVQGSFPRIPC
jgi:hypothetical protein